MTSRLLDPLLEKALSMLVPPLCIACREPELSGAAVCPSCDARLVALPHSRCARCGAPSATASPRCPECRGRALSFASAWAPFAYEATARRLVGALKARGATRVAAYMGRQIALRAPQALLGGTLVPVPAHPARRRRVGINHAAWLADAVGRSAGLAVRDVLERRRGATPQVRLARGERLANTRGSIRARRDPPGGRLVLVDDVYTTGATLDAAARALREAGASEILAVTFARTLR